MSRRGQIRKLAKTDNVAALKLVSTLSDINDRIQATAWVGRYAEPKKVPSILNSALDMAAEYARAEGDVYAAAMPLAWPLRAYHETGNPKSVVHVREVALEMFPTVNPCSSRVECHVQLLNAVIVAGMPAADPVIDSLLANCASDNHWRIVRAFADVALVVNSFSRARANEIASAIADEEKQSAARKRLQAGESVKARKFFW